MGSNHKENQRLKLQVQQLEAENNFLRLKTEVLLDMVRSLPHTVSCLVHQIEVCSRTNCPVTSVILKLVDQAPRMCGRYRYRLAHRYQGFKIDRYFTTLLNDTAVNMRRHSILINQAAASCE